MNTSFPSQRVPSHLVWSIVNTVLSGLLCCFTCISIFGVPTGIAAIVQSSKVDGRLQYGDVAGAMQSSKNAKTWNWVTTGILIVSLLLWVILLATGLQHRMNQQFQQVLEEIQKQQMR
ncbi:CD225/dispanin family protein [Lysobacter pythonis]|uniref:CD225/dispanin family protein n=1 Tax=Solilutibacter pythonis TaxID=2483112 RepID=A0A3M2HSX8_9GAMM|nr:CD225/dispanin family protein [Lysobacter pythonis]RMH92866.1 CD225/dispanin family protein [Lysobacter pythonis]